MIGKYKNILLNICTLLLVAVGILLAGEIDNNLAPVSTGYTLEDIYLKLSSSTYSNSPHGLSSSVTSDTPTMHTVEDIFNVVPAYRELGDATTTLEAGIYATTTLSDIEGDLLPENIASGTEMFGVVGTSLCSP